MLRSTGSQEIGEEFMEEGVAGILLAEEDGNFSAFSDSFDMSVAGSSGTIEYFASGSDFKTMLKRKTVEPVYLVFA
jgi:hypothetical protein